MSNDLNRFFYYKNTAYKDAMNTLRANIQFSNAGKVIALTSALPSEGKSNVAVNLSISFAEAGYAVVLIDCDYRRPMAGNILKMRSHEGLSNLVLGMNSTGEVIKEVKDVDGLYFIDVGYEVPNMSWVYGADRFVNCLQYFRDTFDYVIFDTAPLGSFIEAAMIAAHADGTIIVSDVRKRTPRKQLIEVKNQLELANAKLLGVVFNHVSETDGGYYGRYYSHYYSDKTDKSEELSNK